MEDSIRPKFGRVLIKREPKKTNGIILPDGMAKRHASCIGHIVALGETAGWTELNGETIQTLNIGDKVIFGQHAGVWLDGVYSENNQEETLFMCQDADILCVIKE